MATRARTGAAAVGAGILGSRLVGLVRERTVAHYFGSSGFADVFTNALRGPNVLQNLLGEQALSASFIPIYARRLAQGREEEARRLAGGIFGLLVAITALLATAGVLLAPVLATILFPGFRQDAALVADGVLALDRFPLAVRALRILFPMAGILVLSAWCLAILNSHRRFFLSYAAPVFWNLSIITAFVWAGAAGDSASSSLERLLVSACYGALIGGILQFAVQLPLVWRLNGGLRPGLSLAIPGVKQVLSAFGPALAGRGAVQLSFYLEQVLASFLLTGGPVTLLRAQRLVGLPISLFGSAIAAAELPEMSGATASEEADQAVLFRLRGSFSRMLFLAIPSFLACLLFGRLMVAAIYQSGRFGAVDAWLVSIVLAIYSLGLVPSSSARLLQNAFFVIGDTSTPAKIAVARIVAMAVLALPLMHVFDRIELARLVTNLGDEAHGLFLGAAGLALSSAVVSWAELAALVVRLRRHYGPVRLPWRRSLPLSTMALLASAAAGGVWWVLPQLHPLVEAVLVLGMFAVVYLGTARLLRLRELEELLPGRRS